MQPIDTPPTSPLPTGIDAEVAAAYDARAAEYVRVAGTLEQMHPHDRELIGRWRQATSGSLLDAGCGPGHWTDYLGRDGREARGIDASGEFIASARAIYPAQRFEKASFRELPAATASLGGVLAWYSLIHVPPDDLPPVLAEFARVLVPGGGLLIGFFDGEPGAPFPHAVTTAYFWSPDALRTLLSDVGFDVIDTERRGRAVSEASARPHASVSAVRRQRR